MHKQSNAFIKRSEMYIFVEVKDTKTEGKDMAFTGERYVLKL